MTDLQELLDEATPWPWFSGEGRHLFQIHPVGVEFGYQVRIADVIYWADGAGDARNPRHSRAKANACLIAMAPDLACALIKAKEVLREIASCASYAAEDMPDIARRALAEIEKMRV